MTIPVLLMTADDTLYRHWAGLAGHGWAPARATHLAELPPWGRRGVQVVLDERLIARTGDAQGALVPFPDGLQVVVASGHPSDPDGQRALVAGAAGYIHAYMPVQGMARVLEHVMRGEIWVGKSMLSRMLSQIGRAAPEPDQDWARDLTPRERDVARYVALGHTNQSIADALGISERTVRAHISAIFEKLGVTDRLMLALRVHGIDRQTVPQVTG